MSLSSSAQTFVDVDACVDAILARVGKRVVFGMPVGIGKPNALVNAITRRALADSTIHLTIFTALSLRLPKWRSDLERRFLQPFVARVFGDYEELEYTKLLERGALPANIVVSEFFLEPGAWLGNDHLQQHYLSANYTHVVRDLIRRGVNVIAQLVAPDADGDRVSMSCNPDLVVDLLPYIREQRQQGKPIALVGQLHRELPFMYGDACVNRSEYDFILDEPNVSPLFCPPNMPIGTADYAIAMNVAALIKDGGTLQIGIGELGDAIVYALKLRHEQSQAFKEILATVSTSSQSKLVAAEGGIEPFKKGVYGCTEMLVDGFIDLYRAGILKRKVYPHAMLQRLLDTGRLTSVVNEDTLTALSEAGLCVVTQDDFVKLQLAGVFRDDVTCVANAIITASGEKLSTHIKDAENRAALARSALGQVLRGGVLVHGGFFMGPKAFYKALRDLPNDERQQFAMQRISFINELYGDEALKAAQRRHARFVNTTMMVTGLGAAVSDGLESGRVVSGVGGQYNFVAMAHALPDARSILCVRSTRTSKGKTTSNIIWNYGHETIPRHLRDIVVTEYGIADLRGRTDGEVVEALVCVMDARFQDDLVAKAKQAGKLPAEYRVPDAVRDNIPESLERSFATHRAAGLFDPLPFGSDFTDEELLIAKALKKLQADTATIGGRIVTVARALLASPADATMRPLLARMALSSPMTFVQRVQQKLVVYALRRVGIV